MFCIKFYVEIIFLSDYIIENICPIIILYSSVLLYYYLSLCFLSQQILLDTKDIRWSNIFFCLIIYFTLNQFFKHQFNILAMFFASATPRW